MDWLAGRSVLKYLHRKLQEPPSKSCTVIFLRDAQRPRGLKGREDVKCCKAKGKTDNVCRIDCGLEPWSLFQHLLRASGQLCVGLLLSIPFSSSTGLEDSTSARGKLLGKGGKVFWDRWTSSIHRWTKLINRKTSGLSLLLSEFKGTFKCLFKEKLTFLFYYQKGFQG